MTKNTNANLRHKRNNSLDNVIDKKTKCIEYMESRIKNYFDQKNTKIEIKSNANFLSHNNLAKINNGFKAKPDYKYILFHIH